MLQGKLADVGVNFREVLEVRTKNIQASRTRTENFVSSVSSKSQSALDSQRSDSPLYNTSGRRTPQPGGYQGNSSDLLTLDPSNPSPLGRPSMQSDQQLLVMEEAQSSNTYIQARGEAIEAIERTISELGGIFGQLAQMVGEQHDMIERIDANTEDVVDNVQGAQRELMKYWTRVSGNRWLIAKMFGVLMVRLLSLLFWASFPEPLLITGPDFLPPLGLDFVIDTTFTLFLSTLYYNHPGSVPDQSRPPPACPSLSISFCVLWLDSGMSDPFAIHVPLTLSVETASRGRALEVNTPPVLILSTDVFLLLL